MGLAGVKKRAKLSHDPNNNNWSKSTTNFGHKILSKQGWKPGDYLGAENANHSDHYTAANASHIRVMLREDNLGLGAQVGKGNAETFGLALFSGVLGRLNGKSDAEVQMKQDALRDAELRVYQNTKYGFMNFVRGGLLVGDKMEPPQSTKIEDIKADGRVSDNSLKRKARDHKAEVKTKKSKSESGEGIKEEEQERADLYAIPEKQSKRKDKKKAVGKDASTSESSEEDKAKQEKRRRRESKKADKEVKAETITTEEGQKARLKEEKRAMKEQRRRRKEEKRAKRAAKQNADFVQQSTQTSTAPSESEGTSTPPMISVGGRHAVRHRYIMQKRMASMNANSLKEIFMLQPQAAS